MHDSASQNGKGTVMDTPILDFDHALLPLATAAKFLHMTPAWCRVLFHRGKIRLVAPGGRNLFMSYAELERLLGVGVFEDLYRQD